jgi:hypothetical protein
MAFEANSSRWRMVMVMLGALGFVVLGVWLAMHDPNGNAKLAGGAAIVVFGGFFLLGLTRLNAQGVEIRIDQRGIWWKRWSDDTIPWAAIERISVGEIRSQRFACLFLRDPGAYRSTTFLGKMAGANKAMGFGDIALNTASSDKSFSAMMAAIDQFAPPGVVA